MWDRLFLNRLRKEIPGWVERGWMTAADGGAILRHVEESSRHARLAPMAMAVLGVLTFGAGVITFFAANWDEMGRLAKLGVLFGGMWGAYGAAAAAMAGRTPAARLVGHAMLLLGAVLFGANIQLIAQIYHIEAHYPNGVLLWALGALALVWAVPSQAVATLGLALALLWTSMEIWDFGRTVHWPFLVVWAAFLPPVLWRGWRWATAAALASLFLWLTMTLGAQPWNEQIYAAQLYVLVGLGVYALGHEMADRRRFEPVALMVERFALVGMLLAAHLLVYTDFHGFDWLNSETAYDTLRRLPMAPWGWIAGTAIAAIAAIALAARRLPGSTGDRMDRIGLVLVGLAAVTIAANLFVPPKFAAVAAIYIGWNLVQVAALVWLVLRGYRRGDRFQVNAAFLFFALTVLAIYFDRFWSLMDRSLFFMGGGALLFLGGYALERQRRKLLRGMRGGEDAA